MPQLSKHGIPTRAATIRAKCLDCCCGQSNEVLWCTATQCPLYPYRMGYSPTNKKYARVSELLEESRHEGDISEEDL